MTEHDREPPPIGKTIRWKNPNLDETAGGESDDNIAELVDIVPIDPADRPHRTTPRPPVEPTD